MTVRVVKGKVQGSKATFLKQIWIMKKNYHKLFSIFYPAFFQLNCKTGRKFV